MENEVIVMERDITELDVFVKDFLDVLKKYSDYLVVSGFVSIASGRTRATEDVDLLVPKMEKENFENLFRNLIEAGFWCYQADDVSEVFGYLMRSESIRFARKGELFPNMEFILIDESKKAKWFEFSNPMKMRIGEFEFKIPWIEFEILYKEIILAGEKDIEDARHLRVFFADILEEEKFRKCEEIIRREHGFEK